MKRRQLVEPLSRISPGLGLGKDTSKYRNGRHKFTLYAPVKPESQWEGLNTTNSHIAERFIFLNDTRNYMRSPTKIFALGPFILLFPSVKMLSYINIS